MSHIITRLFDHFEDAEHAVIELGRVGVPHADISLVSHRSDRKHAAAHVREPMDLTTEDASARDAGAGAAIGGVLGAGGGLLAGLGLLAIPGLGPVVAAGWLVSAGVGALVGGAVMAGAGGIVGALTHAGVSEEEAGIYAEGVRRGGTLVSARIADDKWPAATTALNQVSAVDIHQRSAAYHEQGWSHFDENAPPYTESDIEAERNRPGLVGRDDRRVF